MDMCGVARGVAWGGVAWRGRSLTSHHPCRASLPTPVTTPLSRRDQWSPLDTTASDSFSHHQTQRTVIDCRSSRSYRWRGFNSLRPSSHPRQPATFDLSHFRAEPLAGSAQRMLCDVHLRG